jgi:hypothetical protein
MPNSSDTSTLLFSFAFGNAARPASYHSPHPIRIPTVSLLALDSHDADPILATVFFAIFCVLSIPGIRQSRFSRYTQQGKAVAKSIE